MKKLIITVFLLITNLYLYSQSTSLPLNKTRDAVLEYINVGYNQKGIRCYLYKECESLEPDYPQLITFIHNDGIGQYELLITFFFDKAGKCKIVRECYSNIEVQNGDEKFLINRFCSKSPNIIIKKYLPGERCICEYKKSKKKVELIFGEYDYTIIHTSLIK